MMKIGIIGGGSIGLLFAYYLSEYNPVCLYVLSNAQLKLLQLDGLILERNGEQSKKKLEIKLSVEWRGEEDLTILAVKQYHLPQLVNSINKWNKPDKALLFIQNGMGHLKLLKQIKGEIWLGSVEHGALKVNANHVFHKGIGITRVAPFKEPSYQLLEYFRLLRDELFPFVIEEDYEQMLISKLVVNAVINPLTAVLGVTNGELLHNKNYFKLVEMVFSEIEQSLSLQDKERFFQNVLTVCEKTAQNQSSMYCDLVENRPTEIDAILGYIMEIAAEKEINTPIIKSLYYAIKGKECKVED